MKGGSIEPPNTDLCLISASAGMASMKGGSIEPPNARSPGRPPRRTLGFNEGGLY